MEAQLGLKAFLKAVPESIGHELRRKHFQSVREALKETRFLQTVQDSEKVEEGKVLSIAREQEKPKENRVDLEHVVGECLKQRQAQANVAEKNEQPRNAVRGRFRCCCCGEEGHMLMHCPTVKRNRAAQNEATRPKCDAPEASLELPTPLVSSPTPPTLPAAQVRQYSWHHYALKDVSEKRREFVGRNRQANRISPFLPQQVPLVVRAHLLQVVRKVGRSKRSRG